MPAPPTCRPTRPAAARIAVAAVVSTLAITLMAAGGVWLAVGGVLLFASLRTEFRAIREVGARARR